MITLYTVLLFGFVWAFAFCLRKLDEAREAKMEAARISKPRGEWRRA